MKKLLFLVCVLISVSAFSQKPDISLNVYRFDSAYGNFQSVGDTTLYKPVVINSNGKVKKFTYWPSTGSGSMVYPGAGIALSTGSAWGTSITDNSTDWNTAYTDRLKWDGGATGLTAAEVFANVSGTTTAVAAGVQTINAAATATTAYLTAASISGIVTMKGFVLTRGAGTATISIQHLKVTSGTSTVRIGSVLRYRLAS